MSAPRQSPVTSLERVSRRRPATTCTTCRDRRVKCDRVRPTCSQCQKGDRSCAYQKNATSTIQFVTDVSSSAAASPASTSASSDTWSSVVQQQVDFVKHSTAQINSLARSESGASFWTLAEAAEPDNPLDRCALEGIRHPPAVTVGALGDAFLTILASKLPAQDACQHLFANFLLSVHPIIPICHVPTLRQQYADFWSLLSPSVTSIDSLVQTLAVLYTGSASSSAASDIAQSISLYSIYEEVFRIVDLSMFYATSSSLQLLQGYTIVSTFRASQHAPFLAFGFLPQAIRLAQSQRLHIDPKKGSRIEKEARRRLWWHLIFLDVESTIASGLHGIIHPDGHTTQLPACGDPTSSEDNDSPPLSDTSGQICPVRLAMQGHWLWAQRVQRWSKQSPDSHELTLFKEEIDKLLDMLGDSKEDEWPRLYLEMQIDRAYCMLGLRFWQLKQFTRTGCHSEVVRTSRSFVEKYLRLSTLSSSLGLSWFIPGFIQPLHAILILLMHLSGCRHPDTESHSQDLVDDTMRTRRMWILSKKVVPLGGVPWGGMIRYANPRYYILSTLRERVGRDLGWPASPTRAELQKLFRDIEPIPQAGKETSQTTTTSSQPQQTEVGGDHRMVEAALDGFLTGDPMDLLQWDEWDKADAGMFTD